MARPRSDAAPEAGRTADAILDVAESLIQQRGFSAFSYQDIADQLGIRKASIHYHFASKADLGVAVVDRYAKRFGAALDEIASRESSSGADQLEAYFAPFTAVGASPGAVCICGALAGEFLALPVRVRERVRAFFIEHQQWLTAIFERGRQRGDFRLTAPAEATARAVFSSLQGALLIMRATGDSSELRDVMALTRAELGMTASEPQIQA